MIEANPDQIDWQLLSSNPAAIHLLEANLDMIDWTYLSTNPAAIHLIEANLDQIDWFYLSSNPAAIHLLEANPDRVECLIYENPAIFVYDYEGMKKKTGIFVEELMANRFHPKNMDKFEHWNHE